MPLIKHLSAALALTAIAQGVSAAPRLDDATKKILLSGLECLDAAGIDLVAGVERKGDRTIDWSNQTDFMKALRRQGVKAFPEKTTAAGTVARRYLLPEPVMVFGTPVTTYWVRMAEGTLSVNARLPSVGEPLKTRLLQPKVVGADKVQRLLSLDDSDPKAIEASCSFDGL